MFFFSGSAFTQVYPDSSHFQNLNILSVTAQKNSNDKIKKHKNNDKLNTIISKYSVEDLGLSERSVITVNNLFNRKELVNNNKETKQTKESKQIEKRKDYVMENINNPHTKVIKPTLDVVASFRENIRLSLWDRFAVVNFNPSTNFKPAEFINIYGNYNLSCFVPIKESTNYISYFAVSGAAIMLLDNTFKLFFDKTKMIPAILDFVSKGIVTTILKNTYDRVNGDEQLEFESHYYRVTISF